MQEPQTPADRVRFGLFEVDLRSGELRKAGSRVSLQEQPFRILARLLERPGELVTREELRGELWPADTFVDFDHGLNAAIKRLREALGDSAETPRFIETLPRRGYRLIAPVLSDSPSGQPVAPAGRAARGAARRRKWLFAGTAAAVLAGVVGVRWMTPPADAPWSPKRFNLSLPPDIKLPTYGTVAVTRAGDRVIYLGVPPDDLTSRLYVLHRPGGRHACQGYGGRPPSRVPLTRRAVDWVSRGRDVAEGFHHGREFCACGQRPPPRGRERRELGR